MHFSASSLTVAASAALFSLASVANAQINGQIAAVDSATSYCFFLPPMVGGDIAANEDAAIAFCNAPNPRAPGAKIFPPGFVTSVHYVKGSNFDLVSGQIDPTKYNLNPCDAGGQYDIRAPVGATCAGRPYFVNIIEPEAGVWGMKCCDVKTDCDVNHSTFGIRRIFGAGVDFSGPMPDGLLPAAAGCVNGSLPAGATTGAPSTSTTLPAGNKTAAASSTTGAGPITTGSASSTGENKTSGASATQVVLAASAVLASAVGLVLA